MLQAAGSEFSGIHWREIWCCRINRRQRNRLEQRAGTNPGRGPLEQSVQDAGHRCYYDMLPQINPNCPLSFASCIQRQSPSLEHQVRLPGSSCSLVTRDGEWNSVSSWLQEKKVGSSMSPIQHNCWEIPRRQKASGILYSKHRQTFHSPPFPVSQIRHHQNSSAIRRLAYSHWLQGRVEETDPSGARTKGQARAHCVTRGCC